MKLWVSPGGWCWRSELVECIFGITHPTSGEIYLRGNKVNIRHPKDAIQNKIALVTEDRKYTD